MEILKLNPIRNEQNTEYILANHISKFISFFCSQTVAKVNEINYVDVLTENKAIHFVTAFYSEIEMGARMLLAKMDRGEIPMTHGFYALTCHNLHI